MAQQEGIASALKLDDKILNDLAVAQERITGMRDAAAKLENSFKSIGASVANLAGKIKGSGVSLKEAVNAQAATKSISEIGEAAVAVGQKMSSVKKQFDISEEIRRTREKMYELQKVKLGMDRRDIGFSHAEYVKLNQDIDKLKEKLQSLLEARHRAFAGDPSKQAAGEFKEYTAGLNKTNDGLKKMSAYYRELEKSSARAAKEQEKLLAQQQRTQAIEDRAVGVLGISPRNAEQMIDKLRQLKAVKRELEAESKKGLLTNPQLLQQVNTQIANTEAGIKKINAALKTTGTSANIVRSMLMTAFSPFLVQRFISEMVKVRGEFELSQKSLAVIIQDANKAQSMFNEITQIAVRSPFSVQDLLKQTKQLAAYRIETDKLIETTKMLGDISAGVGVDMNRLILAYGQVKAAEFLKGTELRQFSEAGVNMLGGLAKRFTEIYGRVVSVGEVMQMVSKRMVKFADVEAVLREATEAGGAFYKMQEQQAETIQGRISNLNDRIQIMFNNIGKSHDKTIKGIITGLENIISHWQLLSALIEPLLTMMLIKGTASLLGMTKVGVVIRKAIVESNVALAISGKRVNMITQSVYALRGAAVGVGRILKENWLAILIYVAFVLVDLYAKANQFRKTVTQIADEAAASSSQQVSRFNKLLDIAKDTTNEVKDRQKALDLLKSEYGHILDIQKIELSNIDKLNEARQTQIELIRQQAYEEAREKAVNEAVAESQKKAGQRAEQLSNALRNGTEKGYGFDRRLVDLGIQMLDDSDFRNIENHVSDAILQGTVSGVEAAGKEAVRQALIIAGRSEEQIEQVLSGLSPSYIFAVGGAFGEVQKQARIIDETLARIPGEIAAKAELPYKELIKTIGNARSEFEKLEKKPEYEYNPAQKELDYQVYLDGVVKGIKEQIDNGALGPIEDWMKDELNKQLTQAFNSASNLGGDVEQAIRRAQAKVAEKFGKVGRSVIGKGLLKYEEGQAVSDYIKSIDTELQDAINVASEWDELKKQIASGHTSPTAPRLIELAQMFGTPEELQTYIDMINELKNELGAPTSVEPKRSFRNTYKSDLNAFITTLKNARKEMNKLTGEGDDKYLEKLAYLGKKVGIDLGEGFRATNEEIMRVVNQYKGKLEENDRIDLELSLITDNAEHQLDAFQNLAKDLWDRYENSKKLEGWGFIPDEGTTEEVMREIDQLENYLREKGLKEGNEQQLKLADELRERRIQIARTEQEEIAKIMYDAQKKSLTKVEQAYQDMNEKVAKINKWNGPSSEKEAAIAAQVAKSMRDVADAQWDAYKSTEAYALAFGDLENLAGPALSSLRDNLQHWLTMPEGALQPTEIQAIVKRIREIDEAISKDKTKIVLGAIAKGFQEITEAGKAIDEIPNLSEVWAAANEEYLRAQERVMTIMAEQTHSVDEETDKQERLAKAEADAALAGEALATATTNLSNAQNRANNLLNNARERVSQSKELFDAYSNSMSKTIGFVKDFADAFGLVFSDEANAAIEGFEQGISLVGSAIAVADAAMTAYTIATKIAKGATSSLLTMWWPLLAVAVAIGAAVAVFKARDAALAKQVEEHKENVERLEKSYEKLEKAMDKALNLGDARQSYAEMNANLAKQRQELEEAIAANNQRKQNKEVVKETEDLQDQLDELDEQVEESREKWLEMLGAVTDYQGLARDWAADWLDAFKETGDGLDSLKDSFDELYDNLVVGQLWTKVMGPRIKALEDMVGDAIGDGELTESEAAALRAFKSTFGQANEDLKALAESLGIKGGQLNGDTLQRGVETVTETTAQALESILNATRYDVSSTNVYVSEIAATLTGEGENTILANIRSQTRYLADIARIASAVYYPGGHPKGAGALKVITEMA